MSRNRETLVMMLFVGILLLATVLRLYDLPLRPMHHDEVSGHHTYSHDIYAYNKYTYNPVYHGPFLYHVIALSYALFGINDVSLRIMPAIFGIALILLVWPFRKWLGDGGMLLVAALLAVSPANVYFSRFALHDSFFAFFTLASIYFLWQYCDAPRTSIALFLGLMLGFLFTVKENAYFLVATMVLFALVELLFFSPALSMRQRIAAALTRIWRVRMHILAGIVAFAIPFTLLYSSFFRFPKNIVNAVTQPVIKWAELAVTWTGHQKPLGYYIHLLDTYELAIVLLGILGLVVCVQQFKAARQYRFLVLWAAVNTCAFFALKYKTPWLVVHIILPFALAAGCCVHAFLADRWKIAGMVLVSLLLLHSLSLSIHASFVDYDNPSNNELAYVQTNRDIFRMVSDVEKHHGKQHVRVVSPDYTWAVFWYLQRKNISASHQKEPSSDMNNKAILSTLQLNLTNYVTQSYNLGHHGTYYGYYRKP